MTCRRACLPFQVSGELSDASSCRIPCSHPPPLCRKATAPPAWLAPPLSGIFRNRRACGCWWHALQFISSTEIAIARPISHDGLPVPWRAEPGLLKLIAIDTGAGVVKLNPEDGGVVVATVRADAMMQDNESLHVYQSTKHIQVAGGGFQDIKASRILQTVLSRRLRCNVWDGTVQGASCGGLGW